MRVGVSRAMPVYSPDYAGYSFSLSRLRLSRPGCLVPRRGGLPEDSVLALDLEGVHDLKLHHPSSSVAASDQ